MAAVSRRLRRPVRAARRRARSPSPAAAAPKKAKRRATADASDAEEWIWPRGATDYGMLIEEALAAPTVGWGGVCAKAALMKKPAAAPGGAKEPDAECLRQRPAAGGVGVLNITFAKNRTYFQITRPPTNKKELVIEVTAKMTQDHRDIALQLFRYASETRCDKEALRAQRASLLK